MPILKLCGHPGCGRVVAPPYRQKMGPRCPEHYRADNLRRARKQQAAGRTTAHWERVKRQAKEAVGYRCQNCGKPEQPTPAGWLSVHLRTTANTASPRSPTSSSSASTVTARSTPNEHDPKHTVVAAERQARVLPASSSASTRASAASSTAYSASSIAAYA
jgi:hypothetical protein